MNKLGAQEPGIPGISEAELAVMQDAAIRFLERQCSGINDAPTAISDMQALQEPADPHAAGLVSARRNTYWRTQGTHFMTMPHYAD
jgi:hypothetical protein